MKTTLCILALLATALAQDAATGAVCGSITDPTGAHVSGASVTVVNAANGFQRHTTTSTEGTFAIEGLPPGEYIVRVASPGMATAERTGITVHLGSQVELTFALRLAGTRETVIVPGGTPLVETQPTAVSSVIDERAIAELPLNGRRFSDLALLSPGVTDDPRSLTSGSHGDLAFGGVRGLHTSFLVDGADHNNAFFAQARGRYRAPYQFSNEVIQEFRVSSNTYGADLGRSGGAVINVATRSGSNYIHGSAFYYLRDSRFNARHPFTPTKPRDRQHQFGFTLGGPVRKNKIFYFAGLDQHIFHVPTYVPINVVPKPHTPGNQGDYEDSDKALVFAAADRLSQMGGVFQSALLGNAAFAKLDWNISTRHFLSARLNTSRYYGSNNVYFDPANPLSSYAASSNGRESVATESASLSLTSALAYRVTSALRAQFSHDRQQSRANSEDVLQKVSGIIDGFGRASILPRLTNERRLHLADTLSLQGRRHTWKLGADLSLTWIRNYFPLMFGGQYTFDDIRVDPFTFEPRLYGLKLTPLRAFAHALPRYYSQNFGSSISHPDTNEYAFFVQDAVRVTNHFGVTLGLRYDLQTFPTDRLVHNPLWPASGKLPSDRNNFAPRVGFACSLGEQRPFVVRGGWGMFYPRIPQMYNSAVETDNGLNRTHLFLDNYDYWNRVVFPAYPLPLVSCPSGTTFCAPPPQITNKLTAEVSAFAPEFHTPVVQQASFGVEKEIARRLAVGANYLYVHGQGLIRSRDVNLPRPVQLTYPVFDEFGSNFLGEFYTVDSFATWQMTSSLTCALPPCLNPVARPIPQLGAINQFESAASSIYHGLTLSARRRMSSGFYFRLAYTWAHAIDDGQDQLITGRPGNVQNSYATNAERASSVTDQRHRFVFSWIAEPHPFHREHPVLRAIFNRWKFSGVITAGSGRPYSARIYGDANADGNDYNDRLPGVSRNSSVGPDYATTDIRLARKLRVTDHLQAEIRAESFNLFNRANKRMDLTDDGFRSAAAHFALFSSNIAGQPCPAQFRKLANYRQPVSAYAPRQLQFALRLSF
ncbi:MAG: TonB-dependent receptor domain-containing protein [Terriglobales bacterium]